LNAASLNMIIMAARLGGAVRRDATFPALWYGLATRWRVTAARPAEGPSHRITSSLIPVKNCNCICMARL